MQSRRPDPSFCPRPRRVVRLGCLVILHVLVAGASARGAGIDLQMVVGCSSPAPDVFCIFSEPVVSPDGSCIAYTNATTWPPYYEWWPGLAFVPLEGGACAPTVTGAASNNGHQSPAWSPDGARVAFASEGHDLERNGIWTVAVGDGEGSSLVQVVAASGVFDPAWSLDGAWIAYVGSDGIRVAPSTGGASALAVPGGRAPSWGPDGQIVFERGGDLWIRRTDGSERQLTSTPEREDTPAWSQHGVWIAYASNQGGNWDLWVIAASGGTPVRITASAENEAHPSWTVQGDRLVYGATLNGYDSIWTATNLPDWTVSVDRKSWGGLKQLYR